MTNYPGGKYANSLLRESMQYDSQFNHNSSAAPVAVSGSTPFDIATKKPFSATDSLAINDFPLPGMDSRNNDFHREGSHVAGDRERRLSIGSGFSTRASILTDGLLGPKRPRPHKIWKKKYIKVLVVGDSGLGKTTLIRALMSTPGERLQVHDGSYTPSEQFLKDPDSLCSTVSWRDEEDRVIWVYKIQDTPGYGDDLDINNSMNSMIKFIEDQNHKWLGLEQSKDRKDDLSEVEDPRVDLCIFCLPPHRLRAVDLKYMYELGRYVPLVPVVTKADTMTIREASTYRSDVANKISNPMLPGNIAIRLPGSGKKRYVKSLLNSGIRDKINVFKFERDTLERAGVTDHATPIPPFLVVASNDINEELNAGEPPIYWPERRYPWGVAEAFNREHSDMLALRALLLKEALEEINKTKRQRYEAWRRRALGGIKLGRKIKHALLWTIIPAAVCLHIGRSGLNINQVKRRVRNSVDKVRDFVGRKQPAPPPPPPPPAPKKKGLF